MPKRNPDVEVYGLDLDPVLLSRNWCRKASLKVAHWFRGRGQKYFPMWRYCQRQQLRKALRRVRR